MKVVLDEGVPAALVHHLPGHDVASVGDLGWKGTKNGRLLKLIESVDTEVSITCDKNLQRQQVLANLPFAVLLLSTNNWPMIQPHLAAISAALNHCEVGSVLPVECGRFLPKRLRTPGDSV